VSCSHHRWFVGSHLNETAPGWLLLDTHTHTRHTHKRKNIITHV
jgi:hypothetical protein